MDADYLVARLNQKLNKTNAIKTRSIKKDETITTYINNRSYIFILAQGEADLVHYEISGAISIIDHINKNEIFGDIFHSFKLSNELTVIAKKKCNVIWFNYNEILKLEQSDPDFKEINTILFELMIKKIASLNDRAAILTKRSIREKLLAYFQANGSTQYSKTFTLHISYSDLAEYLSVDRSAMMREISHLCQDGIIRKKGREISLLF